MRAQSCVKCEQGAMLQHQFWHHRHIVAAQLGCASLQQQSHPTWYRLSCSAASGPGWRTRMDLSSRYSRSFSCGEDEG